jgi:hypothetical protein
MMGESDTTYQPPHRFKHYPRSERQMKDARSSIRKNRKRFPRERQPKLGNGVTTYQGDQVAFHNSSAHVEDQFINNFQVQQELVEQDQFGMDIRNIKLSEAISYTLRNGQGMASGCHLRGGCLNALSFTDKESRDDEMDLCD